MHARRFAFLCALALSLSLAVAPLLATGPASIHILSPKDHEQMEADETYQLEYEVEPGPGGDHFHVWVDDARGPGIHDRKGKYTLPKMSPGEHTITVRVVDKGHVPTGPEQSIHVVVK